MSARRKAEGVMKLAMEWLRLPVIVGAFMLLGFSAPPAMAHDGTPISQQMVQRIKHCAWHPGKCVRTPPACYRSDLGERLDGLCDRIRFRGEPHYVLIKLAPNGGIRSYQLIEMKTKRVALTSYPFGINAAIISDDPGEREVKIKADHLNRFWRNRPVPGPAPKWAKRNKRAVPANAPAGSSFAASGLALGWSNSVGASAAECVAFTLETPIQTYLSASFNAASQASSTAEQINISATVKGSYGAFSASDTFTDSESYQASANSGFQYWNFANIYTLNTTATGFTGQGYSQITTGNFPSVSGTEYITTVLGGLYATISMSWSSSSESTSTNISDTFTGKYELTQLTAAASVATSDSNSQAAFSLGMTVNGGALKAPGADNVTEPDAVCGLRRDQLEQPSLLSAVRGHDQQSAEAGPRRMHQLLERDC